MTKGGPSDRAEDQEMMTRDTWFFLILGGVAGVLRD
jgi:hypothetical protein